MYQFLGESSIYVIEARTMRSAAFVVLGLILGGSLAAIPSASANPDDGTYPPYPDPVPGAYYFVVYRTADGSIVAVVRASSSGIIPDEGEAVLNITGSPLVAQVMREGPALWYVDLSTYQLVRRQEPSPGSPVPLPALPLLAFVAVGSVGGLVHFRRFKKRNGPRTKKP
jgi:hypothetical protein